MERNQIVSLGLLLAIMAVTAVGLRLRESARSDSSASADGPGTVCIDIRHPDILPGMVVAPPDRVAQAAGARLGLPEGCVAPSAPVSGTTWVFVETGGECRLSAVMPMAPGHRLLCGIGLDVSTADAAALRLIPGIGPVKARALVDARDARGGFRHAEELMAVDGIGPKTAARLAPWLGLDESGTAGSDPPTSGLPPVDSDD